MLAPKIDEKSMSFARSDFLSKCGFSSARIKILRVWGSKFAFKNEAKSIKKWCRDGKAFWDRFFIDFGGFRGPSWEAKPSQEGAKTRLGRPRKASVRQEAKTGKSSQVKSVGAKN